MSCQSFEQNWSNILLLTDFLVMDVFLPIVAHRNADMLPLILQVVPFIIIIIIIIVMKFTTNEILELMSTNVLNFISLSN